MEKTLKAEVESWIGEEDDAAEEIVKAILRLYPDASDEDVISALAGLIDVYNRAINLILNSNKEEVPS